ncbi:MAG: 4-hydroxyphenylacetate 3-hydroxylase N-terminal domain-containing protein [Dehalococcoidales bacterium]|jgi:4-hydroxybutyryl-CoA dehydratase/vinylacetyl-CoA-Delta-isomerase|nr:4-hydroxybutyryl-CoA dehydratase [Dehalococcoidales bacterium]MDP6501581.1 4-hydroxyphenylacetate 3-hydroxylase N-terminal domain-containing protein [Dehalococcoidales bacterium]MDP7525349.1 4-hydroxyphenylacetate 3-hydroxylase N-terminal domain-containing protein [Dehalococcoidales bacterium]
MALKTAAQYHESLKTLHPTAYILGEKVENVHEHPLIKHMAASVAKTYELQHDPEGRKHLVTKSDLTGEEVSRFISFYKSPDDLLAKVRMLKHLAQTIGGCFMRCTGMDAINAVGIETHNCDQKYGTNYWQRLLDFISYIQTNDLVLFSGVTDVKGDRALRPSQQSDPDMYLRVVDRNDDGIVVRGAKIHQTGSLCAHWGLVVPTREMRETDKDYSVSFAFPSDAEGVIHVYGRGTLEARALDDCDLGNAEFGKFAPMVIFEDVFVPWDKVFLCGEYEYAGEMVRNFGNYHRHSHGGCKCGVGNVLIGAAAMAAEYNGLPNVSHINNKLAEMLKVTEAIYGCSIAASVESTVTPSGIYVADPVLSNTSKLYEGKELAEVIRMMIEIAGGTVADLPSEKDFDHPEIGPLLHKYLKGVEGVSTEDRVRIFRLIEKLAFESRDIVSNIHGAGSPETHRMTILKNADIEAKKKMARKLAGIDD